MKYDKMEVAKSIEITTGKNGKGGMMNENPSKAYKAFSTEVRFIIQRNAVQNQLKLDSNYFKQFGCNMDNADDIVKWFSNKKKYGHNYVLHETNVGTIQIIDYDVHRLQTHSGGTSLEKNNLIDASGIRSSIK